MKHRALTLAFLIVFGLGVLAGQLLPNALANAPSARQDILRDHDRAYTELSVFAEALHYIRTEHLDPPPVDSLIAHAIEGMTRALDTYSEHLNEARTKILQEDSEGAYEGIGITLEPSEHGPRVTHVLAQSPAERQGVRADDILLQINHTPVSNDTIQTLIEQIRGGDSANITLKIQRDTQVIDIEIQREKIQLQALETDTLPNGVLWLKLRYFDAKTHHRLDEALKAHTRSTNAEAGVILDLRNNPGGLFSEAIAVAQRFLGEGVIVRVDDGQLRGRHAWHADAKKLRYRGPLIVLINEYSASSAEIVASALQENGRAQVIGERSFGKGTVQRLFPLSDQSALKLTVSAYYSPNDHCIDGHGVVPDLRPTPLQNAQQEADEANARAEETCRGHATSTRLATVKIPKHSDDPALALALETLHAHE